MTFVAKLRCPKRPGLLLLTSHTIGIFVKKWFQFLLILTSDNMMHFIVVL